MKTPPPPAPYLKVWIRHWVNQANWRVGFFVVILSGFCRLLLNRELKQRRRRQQRIQQKVLDLDQKNEQRCTCCRTLLYISRPKLQSTTWNFLISRFMEDGNARRFCFSFNELRYKTKHFKTIQREKERGYFIYWINRPGRLLNFWTLLEVGAYSRLALIKFSPFSASVVCLFCNKTINGNNERRRCNKTRFL